MIVSALCLPLPFSFRLPPSLSWLLWAGALSYDEWPPHRYQRKKGGPDGGFRWSAGALALAPALAQGPGCWVLGAGAPVRSPEASFLASACLNGEGIQQTSQLRQVPTLP